MEAVDQPYSLVTAESPPCSRPASALLSRDSIAASFDGGSSECSSSSSAGSVIACSTIRFTSWNSRMATSGLASSSSICPGWSMLLPVRRSTSQACLTFFRMRSRRTSSAIAASPVSPSVRSSAHRRFVMELTHTQRRCCRSDDDLAEDSNSLAVGLECG
jgi:hypothetical protein